MRILALLASLAMLMSACGSDGSTDSTSDGEPDEVTIEAEDDPVEDAPVEEDASEVADAEPVFTPGSFATGEVSIDGTTIDYVTVTPDGFTVGDTAPVLLAMPPGGQNLSLTESVIASTYATEALARGWVVVSPAAPDGQLYFQGSEVLIPGLLDWVRTWVTPEGDQPHLAGISNGGLSSFRVAALQPDEFRSIVVFPGFPRSEEDRAALASLTTIPIRMYVGETDSGWVSSMEETLATLTDLGGDVALDIRAGEGHVMASLSDGVQIFDDLDAAR